jgi:S1-C subfamily serine protease
MERSTVIKLFICLQNVEELVGMKVEKISNLTLKIIGYHRRLGVYISNVFPTIVGNLLGFHSGDIILSVKDEQVNDPHKLVELLTKSEGNGEIIIKVLDRDQYRKVRILPVKLKKVIAFDM